MLVFTWKCLSFLTDVNEPEFSRQIFFLNNQIENFKKARQVGAELFHAGGRTDRSDEANSRFSQFCERA